MPPTSDNPVDWGRHDGEDGLEVVGRTMSTLQAVRQAHPPQHFQVVVDLKLMIKVEPVRSPATYTLHHQLLYSTHITSTTAVIVAVS